MNPHNNKYGYRYNMCKCKSKFTRKCDVSRHINQGSCKVVREEMVQKIVTLEQSINEYKTQIADLREQLAFKNGEQALTDHLKQQTDRYEKHLLHENSKPRITIQNLAPYDLTPEIATKLCEQYTAEHFLQGPEITYKFLLDTHLTDAETGKRKLACTDVARQIFKGKTADGEVFTDVGAERVFTDVVKPLKRAINKVGSNLSEIEDEEIIESKRKSHQRTLENKRLKKKLAGDLHD